MNESQRAMHRLIEEVVSLSEGTRFLAGSEGYKIEALQVVRACAGRVHDAMEALGGAMRVENGEHLDRPDECAEVAIGLRPTRPPGAPVEGLGDLFAASSSARAGRPVSPR